MPKPAPRLERSTFTTSRTLEYFTERELEMQLGVAAVRWPLALTKELIDNSLDACETESDRPPAITVTVDDSSITVEDNGPGLPEDTLRKSLDYTTRTSDKAHYVSPTRGQLGNALKCLWAGPFVYGGIYGNEERAHIEVTTPHFAYDISVTVDQIRQTPSVAVIGQNRPNVKIGTIIKTEWPNTASFISTKNAGPYIEDEQGEGNGEDAEPRPASIGVSLLDLLHDYATFNPHASFCLHCDGQTVELPAIVGADWPKWKADDPTSAHWYGTDELRTLIAGYVANGDKSRTVRDLIKSFRGLSGTAKQKQVAADANLTGKCLNDMISNGKIDLEMVERLRQAMCAASQPVKANKLGLIGEAALTKRLIEINGVIPETVTYAKRLSNNDALPTVVEVAFGLRANEERRTRIRFGLNFSPALNIPLRSLPSWLQYSRMIEGNDAACLIVHATRPRFEFTSRAKAMLA